jgi:hypothetical protein
MHYRRTTIVLVILGFVWPGGAAYIVLVSEHEVVAPAKREHVMPLNVGNYLPDEFGIAHATGMLPPGGSG